MNYYVEHVPQEINTYLCFLCGCVSMFWFGLFKLLNISRVTLSPKMFITPSSDSSGQRASKQRDKSTTKVCLLLFIHSQNGFSLNDFYLLNHRTSCVLKRDCVKYEVPNRDFAISIQCLFIVFSWCFNTLTDFVPNITWFVFAIWPNYPFDCSKQASYIKFKKKRIQHTTNY